jgi:hypothetical protein
VLRSREVRQQVFTINEPTAARVTLVNWESVVDRSDEVLGTEKARARERRRKDVGVMKDKELKLDDVKAPRTIGGASDTR